jgi:PAS domain S-box-containing protein
VRQLLIAHRYSVEVITDPHRALDRIQGETPAVLVLDLNMPGMSGVELLEALVRSDTRTRAIVVSGEKDLETVSPLLRLGAYDFLGKPFAPRQLLSSVSKALSAWHLERENERIQAREVSTNTLNRFLLDAFPDLLYMLDAAGRFTFINNRLAHIFEVDRESLTGRPWEELFSDPAVHTRLRYHMNERRTGVRETRRLEFSVATPNGVSALLECSARGLYAAGDPHQQGRFIGTYGVLQDVSEVARARRALQQSESKFHALFMESPDAVFISRLDDGQVIEGNALFGEWQHLASTQAAATDHFLWPSPAARNEFVAALHRSPEHLGLSVERNLSGTARYFEINARLIDLEDQPCMLATVRDRSRERQAELQQLELQSQLQQAGKMEALGQLAGGIAHDFNNILASIIGYAELVLTSRHRLEESKLNDYLREVVTAGHRARDLISQMLTFTRATRGEPRPVDLADALAAVSRMLRAAIPSTIRITTQVESDLPSVILDPVQFQQVVMNLMINARDAITGTGEITLQVGHSTDTAPCQICGEHLSGRHIVVAVRDTGHGISPQDLQRIFDMYFTTRAPGKGTGIGLWLVDGMVHAAGGHLTIDTEPGKGSQFTVHLPFERAPAPLETPRSLIGDLGGRIVVVDDEVSVSSFLGEILRHSGFETVVFNESPKALDYLVMHLDDIALLVTDLAMPMLSGMDLAQFVKGRNPELPVIAITGFRQTHDMRRLQEIGVDHLLAKPFGIEDLLEVVRSATGRSNQTAAGSTPGATV